MVFALKKCKGIKLLYKRFQHNFILKCKFKHFLVCVYVWQVWNFGQIISAHLAQTTMLKQLTCTDICFIQDRKHKFTNTTLLLRPKKKNLVYNSFTNTIDQNNKTHYTTYIVIHLGENSTSSKSHNTTWSKIYHWQLWCRQFCSLEGLHDANQKSKLVMS